MVNSWRQLTAGEWGWRLKSLWVLGWLALAVAVGFQFPAARYLHYLSFLLAAIAGITALMIVNRRTILPLSALIVTSVLVPYNVIERGGQSVSASFALVGVLLVVFVLETLLSQQGIIRVPQRIVLPLFLFLGAAGVSLIVGQFPWFATRGAPVSAQLAGLALFIMSGGAFLIFATRLRTEQQVRTITWVFLVAGGLATFLQVFPSIDAALRNLTEPQRIGSMFWTWFLAMAAGQVLMNRELGRNARVALAGLIGLALFHALVTRIDWTSGWLPGLTGLGFIMLLRFPRLTLCLGLLTLPVVLVSTGIFDNFWATEGYSFSTRVAAWHVLGDLLSRSPLIGLGPANYYYYTALFPILGWYVTFSSHNNYVDIIAQTGMIGFVLFGWFMVEMGLLVYRFRTKARSGFARGFAAGVLGGLLGSLAACMLGDWLIPFVYNVGLPGFRSSVLPWIFLGSLVSLVRISKASEETVKGLE